MAKTYHCQLEVRGYELDSFGHVNHAQYISYLEHARWKLLAEEKVGLAEFQAWKRWPVIAQLEVQYVKPAFMGDILDIRTVAVEHSKVSFTFEQNIFRGETLIFRGKVKVVIVNESGRPDKMPEALEALWREQTGSIA